jgi:hypothetical protein
LQASFDADLAAEEDPARRARLIALGASQGYCDKDGNPPQEAPRDVNDAIRDAGHAAIRLRSEAGAQGEPQPERETLNAAVRRAREEGTVRHIEAWDTRKALGE